MTTLKRVSQKYPHPRLHPTGNNADTVFADCTQVYHPTKGWRAIAPNPQPGYDKIGRLMARFALHLSTLY